MNETEEILFHITYQNQEWSFSLLQSDTVEKLKNELYEKTELTPINQKISNWHINPTSDSDILSTLCLKNQCNYLVLHKIEASSTSTQPDFTLLDQENEKFRIGPAKFQQSMLDLLGDRDYDSFEANEHEHLQNYIGFAVFGPPLDENGYDVKQKTKINFLFGTILRENNLVAKWRDRVVITTIYVCMVPEAKEEQAKKPSDYDPYCDLTLTAVFVLRKCKNSSNPCRIFIDDTGRVYSSWEKYLTKNKLPKCRMIFPKNGRYEADNNGKVVLDEKLSPACDVANSVLLGADIASTVGGIASGSVLVVAASFSAVAAAPLVVPVAGISGALVGAYSIGRNAAVIHDRRIHKENLNLFKSSEARGAYINIAAASLGFVGTGANLVVSKLAAGGFNIGKGALTTVKTLNAVQIGVGGVAVVNSSYDIIQTWIKENKKPSLLAVVQLSSSILFFGHAVYNYKALNAVIEKLEYQELQNYQNSLSLNKCRKMLNELLTICQNKGNVDGECVEVVSTLKNILNEDQVFASLMQHSELLNGNNITIVVENGQVVLNGISIDMAKIRHMQQTDVITFLQKSPDKSNPSQSNITTVKNFIKTNFHLIIEVGSLAFHLAKIFGNTDKTITEKILKATGRIIQSLILSKTNKYLNILDKIFPNIGKYINLVCMVNSFFQKLVDEAEKQYQKWLETKDPNDAEPYFDGLAIDRTERAAQIFDYETKIYFCSTKAELTKFGTEKLIHYFHTWFANTIKEQKKQKQVPLRKAKRQTKKKCSKCGGKFYC